MAAEFIIFKIVQARFTSQFQVWLQIFVACLIIIFPPRLSFECKIIVINLSEIKRIIFYGAHKAIIVLLIQEKLHQISVEQLN